MSILDSLLGNLPSANVTAGTDPSLGISLTDLLHLNTGVLGGGATDFVGLGSLDLGFSAPTLLGVSTTSASADTGTTGSHTGGLLGGLL
jgi:hypothetical protein